MHNQARHEAKAAPTDRWLDSARGTSVGDLQYFKITLWGQKHITVHISYKPPPFLLHMLPPLHATRKSEIGAGPLREASFTSLQAGSPAQHHAEGSFP